MCVLSSLISSIKKNEKMCSAAAAAQNVLGVLRTQNACVSTIVPLSDWGFEWVSPEGLGIRVGFTGGIGDLVGFPQMFFFVFVLY